MDCLSAEKIYRYLDGDLSAAEGAALEAHLAVCSECRTAVEARRRIGEAAACLPAFDVPADFASRVMEKIESVPAPAPARTSVLGWLGAAVAGVSALGLTYVLIAVLSGTGLSQAFIRLNGILWGAVRGSAYYAVKGLKILVLTVEVFVRLVGRALETLQAMTAVIGPEIQAFVVGITILLLIAGALWLGRRYSFAENRHEN